MVYLFKMFAVVVLVALVKAQIPVCPPNEVFIEECSSMCEPTCEHHGANRPCPLGCGPPMCQCKRGFVRNDDGNCVRPRQCPEKTVCPPNEEFIKHCSSMCEPTCENHSPNRPCPLGCGPPKCQCKRGFVRNDDGNCVRPRQCPGKTCGFGEVFVKCSLTCTPTCAEPNPPCNKMCGPPKCQCRKGFVKENGKCIPLKFCPSVDNCPVNEVHAECSSMCEPTCDDPAIIRPCPAMCGPPKCQCKPAFVRNGDGKCVLRRQCPGKQCGFGKEFKTCSLMCRPTCRNPTPPCPMMCGPPKCQCKKGFVNFLFFCLPETFCPKLG